MRYIRAFGEYFVNFIFLNKKRASIRVSDDNDDEIRFEVAKHFNKFHFHNFYSQKVLNEKKNY